MEGQSDLPPHISPPLASLRLQDPTQTPPPATPYSPSSTKYCYSNQQQTTPLNTPLTPQSIPPLTPAEGLASQASVDSGVTSTLSFDLSHNSISVESQDKRRRVSLFFLFYSSKFTLTLYFLMGRICALIYN